MVQNTSLFWGGARKACFYAQKGEFRKRLVRENKDGERILDFLGGHFSSLEGKMGWEEGHFFVLENGREFYASMHNGNARPYTCTCTYLCILYLCWFILNI